MINVGYQEGNKGWEGEGGVIISSSLHFVDRGIHDGPLGRSLPCVCAQDGVGGGKGGDTDM